MAGYAQQTKNVSWSEEVWVHTDRTVYLSGERIWFSIYCLNPVAGERSTNSKLAYVELIDKNKQPVCQEIIALKDGRGEGYLASAHQLVSGSYEFRAYTGWMRDGTEKQFYKKNLLLINPTEKQKEDSFVNDSIHAQLNPRTLDWPHRFNQPVYKVRQLVQMELELPWNSRQTALSVAVVPADELEEMEINAHAGGVSEAVDKLEGLPEMEGPMVKAKLTNSRTGEPIANTLGILTKPGKEFIIATALTNANGEWWFNPGQILESGELMVQIDPSVPGNNEWKIELMPVFAAVADIQLLMPPSFTSEQWELIRKRYVNSQLANAYATLVDSIHHNSARLDTIPFGKADKRYQLDEFTRFLTMDEIFREYITEVRVRKQDSGYSVRVRNKWMPGFFETEPLVLVDGMLVNDTRDLMNINPLDIDLIDIYTQKVFIGDMVKDGLILCRTYKGKAGVIPIPLNTITVPYPGLQQQRSIQWPSYSGQASVETRLPDRRNLIYWNPMLENCASDGKLQVRFYHSDQKGRFKVIIRGFGPALEPIHFSSYFEVQ